MEEEIKALKARVEAVRKEYGITREIKIVAATKTIPAEKINLLPSFGITAAGENRVQELMEKYDKVKGLEWHFIGVLQTNKVKYIIDKVALIHSVDRRSLADEIDCQAAKHNLVSDVLIEINIGKEPSKSGVFAEDAPALMDYVAAKSNVKLRGVMSVFPPDAPDEMYKELASLSKIATDRYGADIVSAGMSGDYEKAIRFGANLIRPGSAIFGKRIYNQKNI